MHFTRVCHECISKFRLIRRRFHRECIACEQAVGNVSTQTVCHPDSIVSKYCSVIDFRLLHRCVELVKWSKGRMNDGFKHGFPYIVPFINVIQQSISLVPAAQTTIIKVSGRSRKQQFK